MEVEEKKDQVKGTVNPKDIAPTPQAILERELEKKRQEIIAANEEIESLKKEMERLKKIKCYDDMSTDIKDIHNSLMKQGFTDDQAFQMLMKMIDDINNQSRSLPNHACYCRQTQ